MREQVWAAIITYNSDIDRLSKNVSSIIHQVDKIIIVDNASDNITQIKEKVNSDKVYFILNSFNVGIAAALNQAMRYAQKQDINWVITLDDDSICPDNIISFAIPLFRDEAVGQIVPLLYESNVGEYCLLGDSINGEIYQGVRKSITSASITRVDAWNSVGGFDENFFIDYVDYDFAVRIINAGYKILRMNDVLLDHHIGKSVYKKIFNKKIRVANHSAFRKYYIARNIVIYIKKHKKNIVVMEEMMRLLKVFLLVILFEERKWEKIRAYFRGIIAGVKYRA